MTTMSNQTFQDVFIPSFSRDLTQNEALATGPIELSLQQLEQAQGGAASTLNKAQSQLIAWLKAKQPTTFCGWKVPAGFKW
jgi:hypothetical protein